MGEQVPMGTLNNFVDAVWTTDESIVNRHKPDPDTGASRQTGPVTAAAWYKPDDISRNYELKRITTEEARPADGAKAKRTDFYEYYWAHQISGMTFNHIMEWLRYLLFRPLTRVPKDVRFTWFALWLIAIFAFCLTVYLSLPKTGPAITPTIGSAILGIIAGFAATIAGGFVTGKLVSHFGDVIRYVSPKPENIAARHAIRKGGVELLEGILRKQHRGRPRYDRVVVVAHSLGTIVAYDILTHAFANMHREYNSSKPHVIPETERAKLEAMTRDGNFTIDEYQIQQAKVRTELDEQGFAWRVSDFVTLGSPLTHAEFLLAKDMEDVRRAQDRRILPTCPPEMEHDLKTKSQRFSFIGSPRDKTSPFNRFIKQENMTRTEAAKKAETPAYLHHGALFALTRWTNLFSPSFLTLWGDQVSGPLAPVFGKGIRDIEVLSNLDDSGERQTGKWPLFLAHVKYWSFGKASRTGRAPRHIRELRKAMKLNGEA